jgi:hypothetical protein
LARGAVLVPPPIAVLNPSRAALLLRPSGGADVLYVRLVQFPHFF